MTAELDILAIGEPLMELSDAATGRRRLPARATAATSRTAPSPPRGRARGPAIFTAVGDDAFGGQFLELWDAGGRRPLARARAPGRPHRRSTSSATAPTGTIQLLPRRLGREPGHAPTSCRCDQIAGARVLHASGISQAICPRPATPCSPPSRHARAPASWSATTPTCACAVAAGPRPAVIHAARRWPTSSCPGSTMRRQLTGLDDPDAICDHYLARAESSR